MATTMFLGFSPQSVQEFFRSIKGVEELIVARRDDGLKPDELLSLSH